ncbi:probable DNA-directed RNA polymerases I and III subunit RPAC2 [Nilaparvata lugens]|uniref:probable DNA-directed RNA polymerases I and III subunit RPAC2 n=1 Tax=Nilaparvata lugens TaxID=108931 RepID=UPI000B994CF8|nr:probable DNA-directed RNA polymerases I and III subunit RPAC2 [Nilaparvata lugens]
MEGIAELAGDENSGDRSRTFIFNDEGHTLGNALRSIIVSYPDVTFCGYTVPHPAEIKMHLRIQTNGPRAVDVLQRGLSDLHKLCEFTQQLFKAAMSEYKTRAQLESVHS